MMMSVLSFGRSLAGSPLGKGSGFFSLGDLGSLMFELPSGDCHCGLVEHRRLAQFIIKVASVNAIKNGRP